MTKTKKKETVEEIQLRSMECLAEAKEIAQEVFSISGDTNPEMIYLLYDRIFDGEKLRIDPNAREALKATQTFARRYCNSATFEVVMDVFDRLYMVENDKFVVDDVAMEGLIRASESAGEIFTGPTAETILGLYDRVYDLTPVEDEGATN